MTVEDQITVGGNGVEDHARLTAGKPGTSGAEGDAAGGSVGDNGLDVQGTAHAHAHRAIGGVDGGHREIVHLVDGDITRRGQGGRHRRRLGMDPDAATGLDGQIPGQEEALRLADGAAGGQVHVTGGNPGAGVQPGGQQRRQGQGPAAGDAHIVTGEDLAADGQGAGGAEVDMVTARRGAGGQGGALADGHRTAGGQADAMTGAEMDQVVDRGRHRQIAADGEIATGGGKGDVAAGAAGVDIGLGVDIIAGVDGDIAVGGHGLVIEDGEPQGLVFGRGRHPHDHLPAVDRLQSGLAHLLHLDHRHHAVDGLVTGPVIDNIMGAGDDEIGDVAAHVRDLVPRELEIVEVVMPGLVLRHGLSPAGITFQH